MLLYKNLQFNPDELKIKETVTRFYLESLDGKPLPVDSKSTVKNFLCFLEGFETDYSFAYCIQLRSKYYMVLDYMVYAWVSPLTIELVKDLDFKGWKTVSFKNTVYEVKSLHKWTGITEFSCKYPNKAVEISSLRLYFMAEILGKSPEECLEIYLILLIESNVNEIFHVTKIKVDTDQVKYVAQNSIPFPKRTFGNSNKGYIITQESKEYPGYKVGDVIFKHSNNVFPPTVFDVVVKELSNSFTIHKSFRFVSLDEFKKLNNNILWIKIQNTLK